MQPNDVMIKLDWVAGLNDISQVVDILRDNASRPN